MKCPHCDRDLGLLPLRHEERHIYGVNVIIIICPNCESILAAVNKPKD